jgi:GNAT superfamily N-acetyltransferase
MPDEPLVMIRESLDDLPNFPLAAPFSIRWFQLGDEQAWVELQAPFYQPGTVTLDLFREQFGGDVDVLTVRQCYLLDGAGRPIGTASAWLYDGFRGPEYGRIHWVAIAEQYQGQGLSKPLLSAVCQRLVALRHTKAYLTTSSERPRAVALYRRFGFTEMPQELAS